MTKADATDGAADPFEVWRQLYETNERAWSAALESAMSSPESASRAGSCSRRCSPHRSPSATTCAPISRR